MARVPASRRSFRVVGKCSFDWQSFYHPVMAAGDVLRPAGDFRTIVYSAIEGHPVCQYMAGRRIKALKILRVARECCGKNYFTQSDFIHFPGELTFIFASQSGSWFA